VCAYVRACVRACHVCLCLCVCLCVCVCVLCVCARVQDTDIEFSSSCIFTCARKWDNMTCIMNKCVNEHNILFKCKYFLCLRVTWCLMQREHARTAQRMRMLSLFVMFTWWWWWWWWCCAVAAAVDCDDGGKAPANKLNLIAENVFVKYAYKTQTKSALN